MTMPSATTVLDALFNDSPQVSPSSMSLMVRSLLIDHAPQVSEQGKLGRQGSEGTESKIEVSKPPQLPYPGWQLPYPRRLYTHITVSYTDWSRSQLED